MQRTASILLAERAAAARATGRGPLRTTIVCPATSRVARVGRAPATRRSTR